jgi:hypothetical protein
MTIGLRITGKNSDGEYWLHLVGGGQNAGFNLGDPQKMVGAALLMAVAGKKFVPADGVDAMVAEAVAKEREACAWTATSFLVGDPANGVPLRSPGPHDVAKAIRARGQS